MPPPGGYDTEDDADYPAGNGIPDPESDEEDNGDAEPVPVNQPLKKQKKGVAEKAAKQAAEDAWVPVAPQDARKVMGIGKLVLADPIPTSMTAREATSRNIPAGAESPIDFFLLFFTAALVDLIVVNTNLYGAFQLGNVWKPVTPTIIHNFISIFIYMGMVRQPEMDSYWYKTAEHTDIFGREWVQKRMGRDRFYQIWRCLHFIDVTQLSQQQRTGCSKVDGYYLVRPFLDLIRVACELYCLPGRGLSINEMCIRFKGRHRCRCFNPSKPEKWHLKFYNLNDPPTGYVINFLPYQGKDELRPEGISATEWPVYKLTEAAELWFKDRTVATDNWYTSIPVVQLCLRRGFHFVGTVRVNKSGLPQKGMIKGNPERGYMLVHRTSIDPGNGKQHDVFFTAWNDNKHVHVLSTFEVRKDTVIRKVKEENLGKKKGIVPFHSKELDFPTTIKVYNRLMGGTDMGDQKAVYYRFQHQTRKWPHRIFTHMINLCMVNAHILHRWEGGKMTLLEFTVSVMKSLAAAGKADEVEIEEEEVEKIPPPAKKVYNMTKLVDEATTKMRRDHSLGHYPFKSSKQDRCPCCSQKTTVRCAVCDVPLHIDGEGHENCFFRWHNFINPKK